MKRLILAAIAICVLANPALALDLGGFRAKVEKHTSTGVTVRALCICKQAGLYYLKAGFLTSVSGQVGSGTLVGISVGCAVPIFYSDGAVSQLGSCNIFEALAK